MNTLLTNLKNQPNKKELLLYIISVSVIASWFTISMANGYFSGECELARETFKAVLS